MNTLKTSQFGTPPEILKQVDEEGERIRIDRPDGEPVYLICEDDLRLLEELEDRMDVELAMKAKEEPGEAVSLEEIKARLGMS